MIDLYKIKKKVENSLNNKKYNEKYIPINFQFLDNYLNKNNIIHKNKYRILHLIAPPQFQKFSKK